MARRLLVLLFLVLLFPVGASAQDLVAGWEGNAHRGYTFVAPSTAIRVSKTESIVLRASGSYLYYELPSAGEPGIVRSPGAAGLVGIRAVRPKLNATVLGGFEMRHTARTIAPGERSVVIERGLALGGEVFASPTAMTRLSAIAAYGHANRYVWARGGIGRQLGSSRAPSRISLAAEVTVQGNRDVAAQQFGGVVEIGFPRAGSSLQVRGGYTHQTEADAARHRPYFGAGLYKRF